MLVAHTPAMTSPRFVQVHREDSTALRHELAHGLSGQPAAVSPKFLYDALGSRLFDAITELPEYYPTRTERAIFDAHGGRVSNRAAHPPAASSPLAKCLRISCVARLASRAPSACISARCSASDSPMRPCFSSE